MNAVQLTRSCDQSSSPLGLCTAHRSASDKRAEDVVAVRRTGMYFHSLPSALDPSTVREPKATVW